MIARGECVGGCMTKIALKKSNRFFQFFGATFITHQGSCNDCDGGGGWKEFVGGWVTKIATEKIELTFSIFFGCDFRHPISSINSFKNLKSQNCWTKIQYREFESPAIAMGDLNHRTLEVAILCLHPTFLRICL